MGFRGKTGGNGGTVATRIEQGGKARTVAPTIAGGGSRLFGEPLRADQRRRRKQKDRSPSDTDCSVVDTFYLLRFACSFSLKGSPVKKKEVSPVKKKKFLRSMDSANLVLPPLYQPHIWIDQYRCICSTRVLHELIDHLDCICATAPPRVARCHRRVREQ